MHLKEYLLRKFEGIVLKAVGIDPASLNDRDQVLEIGRIKPESVEEGVKKVVEFNVFVLEQIMRGAESYSQALAQLALHRGFTYDEYLALFDDLEESDYHHYPVFRSLMIPNNVYRKQLTKIYKPVFHSDEEGGKGYFDALQMAKVPLLNFFFGNEIKGRLPLEAIKRHTYITGKSGSGKSEFMKTMIYRLQKDSRVKRQRSIILIEPAGDLSLEVLSFRLNKENPSRVIYIDPYINTLIGTDEMFIPVINPFEIENKDQQHLDIWTQELKSGFAEILKNEFTEQMEALLNTCIATILRMDNPTLKDLYRFMVPGINQDLLEKGLSSPNPEHRVFFQTQFNDGSFVQTRRSVANRIYSMLIFPTFKNLVCGKSTINLENAINSGKVIILNLSKSKMGEDLSQDFGILIISMLKALARKRDNIPEKFRHQTIVFVDEFHNYVSDTSIRILEEMRKYALHLVMAQQNVGQRMDAAQRNTLLGNTALKIIGVNGANSYNILATETGLKMSQLQKLEPFHFYIQNSHAAAKPYLMKAPSYLVDKESLFYMKPHDRKNLLRWFAEQSGYYRKVMPEEANEPTDIIPPGGTENVVGNLTPKKIKPKFEEF